MGRLRDWSLWRGGLVAEVLQVGYTMGRLRDWSL